MPDWMQLLSISPAGPPTAKGWLHFNCPWCGGGDPSAHLGFHPGSVTFSCWRCGRHPVRETLRRLAPGAPHDLVARMTRELLATRKGRAVVERRPAASPSLRAACRWPAGMLDESPLPPLHTDYLLGRGFDAEALRFEWGLRATGHLGPRKHRLIIPVSQIRGGPAVTYQARDVSGNARERYMSCPPEDEAVPLKHTLYGAPAAEGMETVVVVEGPTSVWRLGPGSVCTWGTAYTPEQVALLGAWPRRIVLFDMEPEAQEAAVRLAWDCTGLPGETRLMCLTANDLPAGGKDPADLSDEQAAALMRELTR